jgi:glycosyltransferase involved in cell wall biosynthesis
MRIGIDYRPTQVLKQRYRGVGRYARSLVKALALVDETNQYLLYVNRTQSIDEPLAYKNIEFWPSTFPWDFALRNRLLEWQVCLPYDLGRGRLDLFHFPFSQDVPLRHPAKFVVTIHDLISLIFREHYRQNLLRPVYDQAWTAAVKKAEMIITVSQNSKKDIVERLHIPEERIRVIYEAADPAFRPVEDEEEIRRLKEGMNLKNYVLYVGGMEPRKNLVLLLKAFKLLPKELAEGLRLVIAGRPDQFFFQLKREVEALGLSDKVYFTGFIAGERLVLLYNGASALVLPSLYEGFGFPLLEAMACGTPVVCARSASVPEIAGDAALYFNPTDANELTQALSGVLGDQAMAKKLREKGFKQAAKFSWEKTARETLEVYKEVVG